eukprot:5991135-Prymnesium_polylepis.2
MVRRRLRVAASQICTVLYRAVARIPEVDGVAEADAEHVVGRPVEQVQVEVVDQLGRVQYPLGRLRDVPRVLARHVDRLEVVRVQ